MKRTRPGGWCDCIEGAVAATIGSGAVPLPDGRGSEAPVPKEWPMSDLPRSRVVDYLVYLAVRVTVCVVQALSFEAACGFARCLAWLAYRLDKRHRLVAQENLAKAFPGRYSDAQIDRLVRHVYGHFCRVVVELAHLPRRLH